MTRRTMIQHVGTRADGLQQVRYWCPDCKVWCDFGDPVPLDQVNAKVERCRQGLAP